jgi:hypothetical protein
MRWELPNVQPSMSVCTPRPDGLKPIPEVVEIKQVTPHVMVEGLTFKVLLLTLIFCF